MMNPEIKAKWVAALRSGEYTQTSGSLKSEDGHCCLGVLCEISKLETGFGVDENLAENYGDDRICDTVQNWANLPCSGGARISINGARETLNEHNDNGRTFPEIADAIEEQL